MEKGKKDKLANENLEPEKEIKQEENAEVQKQETKEEPKEEPIKQINEEIVEQAEVIKEEETKPEENQKQTALIEVKTKKKKKGSYIAGTIGAILGGFVAVLPWLLIYILAENMVIPIFGTLLPIGAYLGYKIFRGKAGKPFPVIIAISSILIIALVTMIICPIILLIQSEYQITWENIIGLYSETRAEIRKTIIEDLVAGLIFTIIGIIIVIKVFINKRKTLEEKVLLQQEKQNRLRQESEIVKNAFLDFNSTDKENSVKKKQILKQLIRVYHIKPKKAKLYFENCKNNKLLKKAKGKYYYNQADEAIKIAKVKKIKEKYISKKLKFIIVLIILAIIAFGVYKLIDNKEEHISTNGIEIEVDENTQIYYGNKTDITNAFGEEAAQYYDFIIMDKNNKYDLYGMEIPVLNYVGKDFATIILEDRDYWAPYLGEDSVSQIEDRQFGEKAVKAYYYTYTGTNNNQCRAGIYLYEGESTYLWINLYADIDVEVTELDSIIENLIK